MRLWTCHSHAQIRTKIFVPRMLQLCSGTLVLRKQFDSMDQAVSLFIHNGILLVNTLLIAVRKPKRNSSDWYSLICSLVRMSSGWIPAVTHSFFFNKWPVNVHNSLQFNFCCNYDLRLPSCLFSNCMFETGKRFDFGLQFDFMYFILDSSYCPVFFVLFY